MPNDTILSDEQVDKAAKRVAGNQPLRLYLAEFGIDVEAICQTVRALKEANKALAKDVVTATNQAHVYRDKHDHLQSQLAQAGSQRDWFNAQCGNLQEEVRTEAARANELQSQLAQVTAARDGVRLTGLEANLVLLGFDKLFATNEQGLITNLEQARRYGYTPEHVQKVRDRLFVVHEHPEEDAEQLK